MRVKPGICRIRKLPSVVCWGRVMVCCGESLAEGADSLHKVVPDKEVFTTAAELREGN